MDGLTALDWGTYYFFRHQAHRHAGLAGVMQAVDFLGGYAALGVVVLVAFLLRLSRGRRRAGAITLLVFALACGVVEGLRLGIARRRPDDAADLVGAAEMEASFPARAVFLFTLAALLLLFALWEYVPRPAARAGLGLVTALLIVALCLSQFFLGLHFLTDVLAGLLGGGVCALVGHALFAPVRQPQAEQVPR